MIKHVIWASMIDYPGHTSTVLFVDTCNFNCSYCYNKTLKNQQSIDFDTKILPKLIDRKDFIDHVIISGGEPTTDPQFEYMIDKLSKAGFTIGVHTNGNNPEMIQKIIDKLDFLGIDVKTSWEKYELSTGIRVDVERVRKTIKFVIQSGKHYELRTTVFPKYVTMEDAVKTASWLKENGASKYYLQQFYETNGAEACTPYKGPELEKIKEECNKIIPTVLKTK